MSLVDRARQDAKWIVTNGNDFAISITITNGAVTAEVKGTAKKHHTEYNELGAVINVTNATCTISENDLLLNGYPTRINKELAVIGHKVSWRDAKGDLFTYLIKETYPDEYLGIIVCILSDFE